MATQAQIADASSWFQKAAPSVGQVQGPNELVPEMAAAYFQAQTDFVFPRVFPLVSVQHLAGQYAVWDKDQLRSAELVDHADGAEVEELDDKLAFETYQCKVQGGRRSIGDQARANEGDGIDLMTYKVRANMDTAFRTNEARFIDAYVKQGVWGTDSTPNPKWAAGSTNIVSDLLTGIRTIAGETGMRPDTLSLGPDVWHVMIQNDQVKNFVLGRDAANANLSTEAMANAFGLRQVIVAWSAKSDDSFYFGKNALLTFSPATKTALEPSAGMTAAWRGVVGDADMGIATRMLRDELRYRDVVDVFTAWAPVVQAADLGYFYNAAVA